MSDAGSVYGAFIDAEANLERDRRAEIDRRGTAVVTSSGAFVTLALALAAALTGRDGVLAPSARPLFLAAVAVLVLACLAAVLATLNLAYEVTDVRSLQAMIDDHWEDSTADARAAVAHAHVLTTARLRSTNRIKAGSLLAALSAQSVAVCLLGAAIAVQTAST